MSILGTVAQRFTDFGPKLFGWMSQKRGNSFLENTFDRNRHININNSDILAQNRAIGCLEFLTYF
jgi:hypothetical protein